VKTLRFQSLLANATCTATTWAGPNLKSITVHDASYSFTGEGMCRYVCFGNLKRIPIDEEEEALYSSEDIYVYSELHTLDLRGCSGVRLKHVRDPLKRICIERLPNGERLELLGLSGTFEPNRGKAYYSMGDTGRVQNKAILNELDTFTRDEREACLPLAAGNLDLWQCVHCPRIVVNTGGYVCAVCSKVTCGTGRFEEEFGCASRQSDLPTPANPWAEYIAPNELWEEDGEGCETFYGLHGVVTKCVHCQEVFKSVCNSCVGGIGDDYYGDYHENMVCCPECEAYSDY
jgi:hypothetical protein